MKLKVTKLGIEIVPENEIEEAYIENTLSSLQPVDAPVPRQMAASHPKLRRGEVWCPTCGRHEYVNAARCLANGWPECCGQTMTIDLPAERTRRTEGGGK